MKLIDKDIVIAEIERRLAENKKDIERTSHKNLEDYFEGYEDGLALFRQQFLDTLEVKEVDLENSFDAIVSKLGSTYLKEIDKDAIVKALKPYKDGDKVKVIIKPQKEE